MVSDGREWTDGYARPDHRNAPDPEEEALRELLPRLTNGFQVRDSLFEEVLAALQSDGNLPAKQQALAVLRKSMQAHHGGAGCGVAAGKILKRENTDQLVTREALERYVTGPLAERAFEGDDAVKCECAKLLLAVTTCLPVDVYRPLFTSATLRSLLWLMEDACRRRAKGAVEEMWVAALSTLRNVMTVMELPGEFSKRALGYAATRHDCFEAVDFCHVLLARVLLPRLTGEGGGRTYTAAQGSAATMCRQAVAYMGSVLVHARNRGVLSKACNTLVCVGEQRAGVDVMLELNCIPDVMRLALSVVLNHERALEMLKDEDIYDSAPATQLRESLTPDMHQLSFDALSVISKIAFTASRRQIGVLLERGAAEMLVRILNCPASSTVVRTRAANTLGNLACESEAEVQAIMDVDAIPTLVRTFQEVSEHNCRIEAAYAICACASRANRKQVGYIISCTSRSSVLGNNSCMALVCDVMDFVCKSDPCNEGNVRLCRVVLNALENILTVGAKEAQMHRLPDNPYQRLFLEHQGDVKLARVAAFPDFQIAKRAVHISRLFFNSPKLWNVPSDEGVYSRTLG